MERIKRVNTEEIKVILVDTFCTEEEIRKFANLPYKKIFVTGDIRKINLLPKEEVGFMDKMEKREWWFDIDRSDLFLRKYFEKIDFLNWLLI